MDARSALTSPSPRPVAPAAPVASLVVAASAEAPALAATAPLASDLLPLLDSAPPLPRVNYSFYFIIFISLSLTSDPKLYV